MIALATEVVLARRSPEGIKAGSARPRKKQKKDPIPAEALHGVLAGLRVYIMHCKEQHFSTERPISDVIGDQCREMLAPHKLGLELLTADQGMKIGASFCCRRLPRVIDARSGSHLNGRLVFVRLFLGLYIYIYIFGESD